MGRARGFTLVEALIAVLLITGACLIIISMLEVSLRYGSWSQSQAIAAMLAEKRIEQIRDWAHTQVSGVYNFDGSWTSVEGAYTDPAFPDYQVNVAPTSWYTLNSPCAGLSSSRAMLNSARQMSVTVRRGSQTLVSVNAFIGEPPRALANLLITQTGGSLPVAHGASISYSVAAYDAGGQPIPDVFFRWYVAPGTANGSVTQSLDGHTANLINQYVPSNGSPVYTGPGTCKLKVRAVVGGVERWQTTATVSFQ